MASGTLPETCPGYPPAMQARAMTRSEPQQEPQVEGLMDRVQEGDMEAYKELVRQCQHKLFRFISSYHRDPEDAMEVLQDTLLKVYTARRTWECRSSFSAWVYRIAANASIDRYRRGWRHKAEPLDEMVESEVHKSASAPLPLSPHDHLAGREKKRALERAIHRLPTRQREVVSMRYFGEMQLEEIAQSLGCPLGTVKSNLHKAIHSLRVLLRGQREVLGYE